ncbi:MAG: VIT1/CCC1 transporter family protein [Sulfurimicrobium sp.]|nr:VIT1/CCC1 transporter family protein [Sulfurimicrobium sp.]MDZ7655623.1 VIT1/CCC1 transporter family protein [Sulfurimicrobium sp.]
MNVLESWREEKRSAYLYRIISDAESGTPLQILFLELAQAAERQAEIWAAEAAKTGVALPQAYLPELRVRITARLVRRFGVRSMRPVLAAMKVRGMSLYASEPAGHAMPTALEQIGRRHKGMGGGNLRAAVFGVNDGLVSNASLIMGVAGASGQSGVIMLSGIAGLLAGAFSMAAGEYLSVRSQREMYEYQIGLERDELEQYPDEEAAELALIFQAKGLDREEARRLSDKLIADPDLALDTLTREELGLNPDELGSPWGAALFSLIAFAIGAMVPLLPFLVTTGSVALLSSIGATVAALFFVGAALSLFTGRHAWLGGLRMLAIGAAAGGATFLIGKALGVTLA